MMLDLKNSASLAPLPAASDDADLGQLIGVARLFFLRHYKTAIVCMVLGVLAALGYLKTASPSFTAFAAIEFANREGRFLQEKATVTDLPANVERDVAHAKSWAIAEAVAKELDLVNDPEFNPAQSGLLSRLHKIWSGSAGDPESQRLRNTVMALISATKVAPDPAGSSFSISVTTSDGEKSARITNAIANAFMLHRSDADAEIRKQAADWLVSQSDELARRAKDASAAVADFIKTNNLILIDGKPIDQKNLEEINKRVNDQKVKLNDAKYKVERIKAGYNASPQKDILQAISIPEILADPVISRARERYSDLAKQVNELQQDFGKDSQKIRQIMAGLKGDILIELGRWLDNANSEYVLVEKRYQEMLAEQEAAVDASHRAIALNSQLAELQATERNYRTLYQNFLQHSAEAVQELSFPVRSVRIAVHATAPPTKSWPKPAIVLAIGSIGGLLLALAAGAVSDLRDDVFRTVGRFEKLAQVKALGMLPKVKPKRAGAAGSGLRAELASRFLPHQQLPAWTLVKLAPNSRFVAELVSVRLAMSSIANSRKFRVFGITSALAGEGKSSVSSSLAVLAAQARARVLVIDMDFRNPALTQMLAPQARLGLADVLSGRCEIEDILVHDEALNLTIAPNLRRADVTQTVDLLTSGRMQSCLAKLKQAYDLVLIDLPPLIPIPDVRATIDQIDSFVFVVEWAKTSAAVVQRAMDANPEVMAKVIGGILNKVDFKSLTRYDPLATSYYLRPEFSRYLEREQG